MPRMSTFENRKFAVKECFFRSKIGENAKIGKSKWDILANFQTMWCRKKARLTYLYEFVSGLEVTMGVRKFCHKWNICNFDCEFVDASHRLAWKRRFCHKYYIFWLFYHSKTYKQNMVFENLRKSLIQHCERSELGLHFEWTKAH